MAGHRAVGGSVRVLHLAARQRLRRLRALTSLLWRTSRALTLAALALTALRGVLPSTVILATGLLVGAVPDAVASGLDSPGGVRALWALAAIAGAFLAGGVVDALDGYVRNALSSLFALTAHDAVAAASGAPVGVAELEDPEVAGELAAVEEYDRDGIYRETVESLLHVLTTRIRGATAFAILLGFTWWAPFVMLVTWRVSRRLAGPLEDAAMSVHHQRSSGLRRARYLRSLAVESPAAKEIRVFGLADWITGRYAARWLAAMEEVWRGRRAARRTVVGSAAVLLAGHGLVLGALGWSAWTGGLSVAALVVFVQAVLATDAQGAINYQDWVLKQALEGTHAIVELECRLGAERRPDGDRRAAADFRPEADRRPDELRTDHHHDRPAAPDRGPVSVSLEDVSFTYREQDKPTLDGLTLTVPAGQSLAVVGANGAGKTTLIKLLCGLYEPDTGRVLVDGTADPARMRVRVGVIFQNFVRYELPLRANIGFGCLPLADDRPALESALRDAGGGDVLAGLPAGWDSVLARAYPDGADLSGGQWQKVALARALMAVRGGAGLLVLDEPTAHLDVRAEAELFDRFVDLTAGLSERERTEEHGTRARSEARTGVTTILVSHRLSSVRRADRIVVLAQGRIVEDGTHEGLLAAGGTYASMYTLQADQFASARQAGPHA